MVEGGGNAGSQGDGGGQGGHRGGGRDFKGGSPFPPGSPMDKFFHQFGDGQFHFGPSRPQVTMAQGSGFFISPDGYIVTNNHVVENEKDVKIVTAEGKTIPAKVIGTDPKSDLALLKVDDGQTHPFVDFAKHVPRVGDWVIAVGNPFGLGGTVTAGIVSARGRDIGSGPYDNFLQIDAPVNRGNSGGPTFNGNGHVVGVNTAIFSPSGGSVGIGFAISGDVVQSVVAQLKSPAHRVTRGWIGVQSQPVSQDIADGLGLKSTGGALVADVQAGSPALAAGIKAGDVIVSLDGQPVPGPSDLARRVAALGPDKEADVSVMRDGKPMDFKLKLGTLPNTFASAGDAATKAAPAAAAVSLDKFGMKVEPAPGGKPGVVTGAVDPSGAAAAAGLKDGDVILDANGKPVKAATDLTAAIDAAKKEGRKAVLLRVDSAGTLHFVALALAAG
ncbi:MAG: trypsin-like peptidase domain-containing protein [Hyphomicrobiales bacterium]|nr:trypsin-like peptidase domain-containing protein [Hyphomicrobiales bacterium]